MRADQLKVNKVRLLKRVILVSWIALILCFIVKLFGGNYFEIMSNSEGYKALCLYADSHNWLKFIIGFISSMICQCLYMLAILQKYKLNWKQLLITTISIVIICIVKLYNTTIGAILDVWSCFILPCIFLGKNYKKYWQVLVAWIITFIFQLISLLTKNLGLINVGETLFIGLIYSIDVYIMFILYYLYRNYSKEVKDMGILWAMFMGKPISKLQNMLKVREDKLAKLKEDPSKNEHKIGKLNLEISAIKQEIAKQEKESK